MLIETKPTELAEAHVQHQETIALQEATNLIEALHLEAAHHLESEAQGHQPHQEQQRKEVLAAAQEAVEQPEALHLEALTVKATEVQAVHQEAQVTQGALAHHDLRAEADHLHLGAEVDDKLDKS